nr:GntR family transcriptional regulator [Longimycelium tulufanense]
MFRPLRTGNAFEETVERLLQAIRLGVVGPGEKLPAERELAARLNVSRVTLREAIRALQQAGFVQSRRGRYGGTFVVDEPPTAIRHDVRGVARRWDAARLADVFTFRHVLETGAAEAAAARELTAAEREHLTAKLAEAGRADLADFRRRDSRLHLAIAEVTGSSALVSAVADVRMRLNELLDAIPLLERNIEHSREQHEQVVAAILAGNPSAAREAMAEHLAGTASLLRGFLG